MKSKYFVGIDLETTGLDPTRDYILEIAVVLIDHDFDMNLDSLGTKLIRPGAPSDLPRKHWLVQLESNPSALSMHIKGEPNLLTKVLEESPMTSDRLLKLEQELINLVPKGSILFGSNVGFDRNFLKMNFPLFEAHLDYHNLDVSSVRYALEAIHGKKFRPYIKNLTHRAFPDILETVAEMKYYKTKYLTPGDKNK